MSLSEYGMLKAAPLRLFQNHCHLIHKTNILSETINEIGPERF